MNAMIYFEFDQFDIPFDESFKLKRLLPSINQSSVIYIVGHTDHIGHHQYNLDLSENTVVSEQYLLDLERKAFLELCKEKKTLERIESIVKYGKILRN